MQFFEGTVVSQKTPQTVGVEIPYFKKHAKYQKIIKLTTKLLAHNEMPEVKLGDTVKIVKSRPYSKSKHFLITEIITASKLEQPIEEKLIKTEEVKEIKKEVKSKKSQNITKKTTEKQKK